MPKLSLVETFDRVLKTAAPLVAVVLAVGIGTYAFADDDFLSILGGADAKPTATEAQKSAPGQPSVIMKLVTDPKQPLTLDQIDFVHLFEAGEKEKALYQWSAAFAGTSFASTANGRALANLVLYQNGIQVFALEQLLKIEKPAEISKDLINLWKAEALDTAPAWSLVSNNLWKPAWSDIFGQRIEIRVRGRGQYGLEQAEIAKDLIRRAPPGSKERALIEWQLVLALATSAQPADSAIAAKALAALMKEPNNPISQDLMTLTAARLLYQNGFYDAAAKYYEKVPKTSEDWFDAQEELAWSYMRKGEPQNTLAITKTLVQPIFASEVGPEALFLRSLANLKVCDYPEVSKTLTLFRDRYKGRASALIELTPNANTPVVNHFISREKTQLQAGRALTEKDLGGDAAKLPRFITRDEVTRQSVQAQGAFENEAKKFDDIYSRSLTSGVSKIGFQAELEQLKTLVQARAQAARSQTYDRVKTLAEAEINEIAQILSKLHIVEAEVLQQVSLVSSTANGTGALGAVKTVSDKKGTTGAKGPDRIWFPEEKETWFDELANYQIDLKKGCQAVKR